MNEIGKCLRENGINWKGETEEIHQILSVDEINDIVYFNRNQSYKLQEMLNTNLFSQKTLTIENQEKFCQMLQRYDKEITIHSFFNGEVDFYYNFVYNSFGFHFYANTDKRLKEEMGKEKSIFESFFEQKCPNYKMKMVFRKEEVLSQIQQSIRKDENEIKTKLKEIKVEDILFEELFPAVVEMCRKQKGDEL